MTVGHEDAAHREWYAWRAMCVELAALGIDANDAKALRFVQATKLWGEELAALRRTQIDEVAWQARDDARSRYDLDAMLETGRIP